MKEKINQPRNKSSPQLKPSNPPMGRIEISMIQLKNFGKNFKTRHLESKTPMNWNNFGEGEWQIIEKAIKNQTLPSVRYKDTFEEGENPRGKTYEITKWNNLVTVNNFCQKFDVFNEAWINSREKQGYKFLSHGLFQCRIQGLHSPDFDIKICVSLVDERIFDFKESIVGIGQLELHQNVAYFSVIPGLVIPLRATKHIKLLINTKGYERYLITEGILAVEYQSRVMFTHFPQEGLLDHIQRGRMNEEVLVRTTRNMVDYTFHRIPTQGMLSDYNLAMWNFPQILPVTEKYNVLDFVHQDGNSVSLKFARPSLAYQNTNQEQEENFRKNEHFQPSSSQAQIKARKSYSAQGNPLLQNKSLP